MKNSKEKNISYVKLSVVVVCYLLIAHTFLIRFFQFDFTYPSYKQHLVEHELRSVPLTISNEKFISNLIFTYFQGPETYSLRFPNIVLKHSYLIGKDFLVLDMQKGFEKALSKKDKAFQKAFFKSFCTTLYLNSDIKTFQFLEEGETIKGDLLFYLLDYPIVVKNCLQKF